MKTSTAGNFRKEPLNHLESEKVILVNSRR
jgi:hypothetical protein